MGLGKEDIFADYTNVLNENGMSSLNPTQFTQDVDSLVNPLIDPAQLQPGVAAEPAATPLNQASGSAQPSLWDRFLAWLDKVFHINKSRNA